MGEQPPPVDRRAISPDFVVQTAAVLARLEANVQHIVEGQRQQGQKLDSYVVEHRSHHMDDRQWARESQRELKNGIEQLVDERQQALGQMVDERLTTVKEGRKIYFGLLAGLVGAAGGAVIVYLIERIMS